MRWLALGAVLLPLACNGACTEGSASATGSPQRGSCEEEGDASLELLQLPSARSPTALAAAASGRSAGARAAVAADSTDAAADGASALLSEARANASTGGDPLGISGIIGKVKGLMPDTFKVGLNHVALEAFASLLNSTLHALQLQADGFMKKCSSYGDALLHNTSTASDRAIEGLQSSVATRLEPLQQLWLQISNSIMVAVPPLSSALSSLGQEDMASQLEVVVGQASSRVTKALENATRVIAEVGNATREQKESALAQLNASTAEGLAAVASFEAQGVKILQGMIQPLVQRSEAPPELKAKLTRLLEPIKTSIGTLADGLRVLFSKTLEASELALEPPEKGRAVRASVGFLLAAAFVGSWL